MKKCKRFKNPKRTLTLILTMMFFQLFISSCATIFSGTTQQVSFVSEPPDANVVAVMKNGTEFTLGKTPCTVEIKKKTRKINFVKDGYYTENYDLRQNANIHWGYWADLSGILLVGTGFVPMLVDLVNQSYLVYPEQIKTELKKK